MRIAVGPAAGGLAVLIALAFGVDALWPPRLPWTADVLPTLFWLAAALWLLTVIWQRPLARVPFVPLPFAVIGGLGLVLVDSSWRGGTAPAQALLRGIVVVGYLTAAWWSLEAVRVRQPWTLPLAGLLTAAGAALGGSPLLLRWSLIVTTVTGLAMSIGGRGIGASPSLQVPVAALLLPVPAVVWLHGALPGRWLLPLALWPVLLPPLAGAARWTPLVAGVLVLAALLLTAPITRLGWLGG
ncbi:MAG: hypothetical protein SV108_04715 [Pseudomonadota bacterium]|nr:hypothetical protein [Pseudomonadota bacterium]